MVRRNLGMLLLVFSVACLLAAIPALAESHVRIVRLSDVEGAIQIDRNLGQGFEKAFLNLPITEGMKLQAKEGRAEVEFEDGTAIRFAPGTSVDFSALSLRDDGTRVSTVTLRQGMAYVSFSGKRGDEFTIDFGRETIKLAEAAHFRIALNPAGAELAVFKGGVKVEGSLGTEQVSKGRTAHFDLANQDSVTLAKNIQEDPLDAWDKQQDQYHARYASNQSSGSPYAYGISDLNYYGGYYNVPGYGMMWQPYFVGAGWDPFMDGMWSAYPGFGYMWVSPYPWGWMPYRYGSWMLVPGYGWMWQPGRSWGSFNTLPVVANPPRTYIPPKPPASTGTAPVLVTHSSPASPVMTSSRNKLVIHNDSAGLGLPRGSVSNLSRLSNQARLQGSASTNLRTTTPMSTSRMSSMQGGVQGGASLSRPMGGGGQMGSAMSTSHSSAPSSVSHSGSAGSRNSR
jgi:FecR protein